MYSGGAHTSLLPLRVSLCFSLSEEMTLLSWNNSLTMGADEFLMYMIPIISGGHVTKTRDFLQPNGFLFQAFHKQWVFLKQVFSTKEWSLSIFKIPLNRIHHFRLCYRMPCLEQWSFTLQNKLSIQANVDT